MRHKAFALVLMCILIAANMATNALGATSTPDAATSPEPLSSSVCASGDLKDIVAIYNFDSPDYKATDEPVPDGVSTYFAKIIQGRLDACRARASVATQGACTYAKTENARTLWQHLNFCEGALGLRPVGWSAGSLLVAREPTFYVLLGVGAGSGGSPGGTSPAGGKGGGGGATGSTATGSTVDTPSYFLLFLIAQRLEHQVCKRSGISLQDCDAHHPLAVVPESTWNLEDFRSQCAADPYVPADPNNPYGTLGDGTVPGHGTIGAVVLNGSTVTADGTFAILTVYGSSEANYTSQVVECSSGGAPFISTVWSDNISQGNKTTALSFFPLALAGTLIAAHSAAKQATIPAPNPSASPNVLASFFTYQTDIALGSFAANTSSLTLGNPSSGLTLRHAFEAYANSLEANLNGFCNLPATQEALPVVCKALKLPVPKDALLSEKGY
jgi:hypothetical protein